MKNKNIIEAMKSIFMHGFEGVAKKQYENRLDCTRKELLESADELLEGADLLIKFIDFWEKKLKD
jgi:hypothetical protein